MAGARSKTRKRALQILFEADQRGVDPVTILADWVGRYQADKESPQVADYTMQLVEGVQEHSKRIDDLIGTYAVGWTIDRMPGVDRNVLRLGIYELLWENDVPDVVAIDEAVELAKEYSTDDSPAFVNGLLARMKELKPTLLR